MSELLNKISVKTVCGTVAKPEKPTMLMRVFGISDRIQIKQTAYGESAKFVGQFKAINIITGEEYASGAAYLPRVVEEMLSGAVSNSDGGVEFALDIGVKPDQQTATGYVYTVTPLVELAESDPLKKLGDSLPKLPALKHDKGKSGK